MSNDEYDLQFSKSGTDQYVSRNNVYMVAKTGPACWTISADQCILETQPSKAKAITWANEFAGRLALRHQDDFEPVYLGNVGPIEK